MYHIFCYYRQLCPTGKPYLMTLTPHNYVITHGFGGGYRRPSGKINKFDQILQAQKYRLAATSRYGLYALAGSKIVR